MSDRHPVQNAGRRWRLPLPREHGAWVMVYAPSAACLFAPGAPIVPFVLYLVCITAVFFAQSALGVVLRGRGGTPDRWWLAICGAFAMAAALVLVLAYGHSDLLLPGLVAAALLARQLAAGLASGKRIDRSLPGEVLAVGGLALTGPAAWIVATGALDVIAVGLWLAFWSKFISGVFYVKMLVAAAKPGSSGGRWRQGRGVLGYHACLLIVVLVVSHWVGWGVSWLIVTAYLPLFVRSGVGLWRLSNRLPRLKIVGLLEVCFTAWFVLFCGLVLRALVQGIP